jgi:hypothetical protein
LEEDDLDEKEEKALAVAKDIECQWDLYIVNSFSLKELKTLDQSKVDLPQDWFQKWLEELNTI